MKIKNIYNNIKISVLQIKSKCQTFREVKQNLNEIKKGYKWSLEKI